jgi:CHRD domain-containing protein
MKRTHVMTTVGIVALLAATSAVQADQKVKARLNGFNEVPAVSTTGSGEFTATVHDDSVDWELTYQDLEGATTAAAHIHLGQKDVNGGVSVFFCGTAATPCTAGSGSFKGTFGAADVIGPAGQGIAAAELAELIAAMRAGETYVNVHTNKHPGGEIRGQVGEDNSR